MTVAERPIVHCDRDALASALSISPRRINQLADLAVVKRLERGRYDLFASLTGYIVYLHDAMGKKSTMDADGTVTNTKHQRSRLLDVELATAEIALAKAREQVMAIDDHKMIIAGLILETKARVMTIGARAAPKVLNQKSRAAIKKLIDAEAVDTLVAMSKVELKMPDAIVLTEPPAAAAAAKKRPKKKARARAKRPAKKTQRTSKTPAP